MDINWKLKGNVLLFCQKWKSWIAVDIQYSRTQFKIAELETQCLLGDGDKIKSRDVLPSLFFYPPKISHRHGLPWQLRILGIDKHAALSPAQDLSSKKEQWAWQSSDTEKLNQGAGFTKSCHLKKGPK